MPVITKYICDRCSAVIEDASKRLELYIYVKESRDSFSSATRNGILCTSCAKVIGMEPYKTPIVQTPIEQLIRELVYNVVEDINVNKGQAR